MVFRSKNRWIENAATLTFSPLFYLESKNKKDFGNW